MTTKFLLKLQSAEYIAPHVKHFVFSLPENESFEFNAGQFISLHIETSEKELRRNYSVANPPSKKHTIEIACTYLKGGVASELLFNLKPNDTVTASGPYGIFVLKPQDPQRYVLVATGTGVTPYRSMLPSLKEKLAKVNPNLKIVLLFGARSLEEALYRQEFIDFAAANKNFEYMISYSRELPTNAEQFEHAGYVQAQFKNLNINPATDIFYLCGNPNMVDEAFAELQVMGMDRKQIQREKYISGR